MAVLGADHDGDFLQVELEGVAGVVEGAGEGADQGGVVGGAGDAALGGVEGGVGLLRLADFEGFQGEGHFSEGEGVDAREFEGGHVLADEGEALVVEVIERLDVVGGGVVDLGREVEGLAGGPV